ncbi:MAG TPA: LysM peptidoglycan-binding domain-containing protein [Anaerolineae bacterium]|nr:LysM peptidoglycan-binding domain-containing protein [Anaerolineae bacterium]
MATGSFSQAEQQTLARAPQLIRHLMTIADKGVVLTRRSEIKALEEYLKKYESQNPIVRAIIAAQPEKEEKIEADSEETLRMLGAVGTLIESRTTAIEGDAVRDFLMGAADAVAKASREQSMLKGAGASPAEEKAIAELATALKASDEDKRRRNQAAAAALAHEKAEQQQAKAQVQAAELARQKAAAEAKAKAEAEGAAKKAAEEAAAKAKAEAPARDTLLEQAKARAETARKAQEKAAEQAQAKAEAEAKARQLAEQIARQREQAAHKAEEQLTVSQAAALKDKAEAMKKEAQALEQQAQALQSAGQAAPAAAAPVEIYVVKRGDTLSGIAKALYGNAGRWKEIYEANRNLIKDPNLIKTGWKLRIPRS